jgi:class 3 adenylate cyclase
MNRKIAAIFAADVAGYSKLVAEDEEETLRRLASYRSVMDDFITRAGGRIFNTAGDAVLAEFSSAVEAVRCAIDIQESLRTRNLAYPTSRGMNFRIGITIGDVVERNGDLLGDGVNIAARLEGIAPVGGICISRAVHEQVANKLSVVFADIGEQQVKNIPTPVHAYKFDLRPDDVRNDAGAKKPAKRAPWILPVAIAAPVVVIAVAAAAYLLGERERTAPAPAMSPAAVAQSTAPVVAAQPSLPPAAPAIAPQNSQPSPAAPVPHPAPPQVPPAVAAPPQPAPPQAGTLVADAIPFIGPRQRTTIQSEYMPGADHKALAISNGPGPIGFITGQADDETAKAAALDICEKRVDAASQSRKCEIFAVGNTIAYVAGTPPMPSQPWVRDDPAFVRPLVVNDIPLLRPAGKATVEKNYPNLHPPKALVIGPQGGLYYLGNQQSADEAERRILEHCGNNSGVPCLVVAVNDNLVVPTPATMKVTGFLQTALGTAVAADARDDVAHRLANGSGWTAVAVGTGGHPGVAVGAANEQNAIAGAMADCAKHDTFCHVIGIGPFSVEPN